MQNVAAVGTCAEIAGALKGELDPQTTVLP
jgi:hypothetical protein